MKASKFDFVILLVGLLLVWELLHLAFGQNVLASPIATIGRAVELLQTENFWRHAKSTGSAFGLAAAGLKISFP